MDEADSLTTDEIFEILSGARRRNLLHFLYTHGKEAGLRELAEATAAVEFEEPLTEEEIKRVYIAFYQTHIPKLESAGIVRYDSETQHVALEDRVTEISRVLPQQRSHTRPWPVYYLGVAVIGGVLSIVSYLGLFGLDDLINVTALAAILAGLLVILSSWYYLEETRHGDEYEFLTKLSLNDGSHSKNT